MRTSSLACLSLFLTHADAFKISSAIDWLYSSTSTSTTSHAVSHEVVPHKVAIIGAGAAGSSSAFWVAKAKARANVAVEVDVYEKEGHVGGRSTVVYPYDDVTLDPVELGGSIFVESNKNLWRASDEFNLERLNFDDGDGQGVGFWDGESFVFRMNEASGILGWWESIKAVWRYGLLAPRRTTQLVESMVKQFLTLYTPERATWTNITELTDDLRWTEMTAQTAAEFFDSHNVLHRFSREVIEAATRVNYGQNVDEIHAVEGQVSLAADNAVGVKGGNFQIFQNFLARSGAKVHLNTTVVSISETRHNTWTVKTVSPDGDATSKEYNDVIIAAPFHGSGITLSSAPSWSLTSSSDSDRILPIPPQPYVHLHVTLLTTPAQHPLPEYFGLAPGSVVPQAILTTYENARAGGKGPEFNSLTYHGKVSPNRDEHVVKIFSKEEIDDEWLKIVFGEVGWVYRKVWDAYPVLTPTTTFPPIHLAPGLHYVNAFEPLISTMETETIASRNVVDQIFRARFGVDLCGKHSAASVDAKESPESQSETQVEGEAQQGQQVLTAEPVKITQESSNAEYDEGYVYGWDC